MSKRKNQYFDVRLYKEGIRQLRIPGIVSGVILLLCGILMPLMYMIGRYDEIQYDGFGEAGDFADTILGLLSVNSLLWICPYILAGLMTVLLFRFLNTRNGSDFYHSIPQTRVCVATSFLASVFTWVLGLLVGMGLLSCLFAEALPYITVNWGNVLQVMIRYFTASILAVGGTFLAVSMTGTLFTNFAVAVMILCVPTLLSLVLEQSVISRLFFMQSVEEMLLCKYNNLTNICGDFIGFFTGISSSAGRDSILISAVYTTILGIVYGIFGICMYQRRCSESAGQPACSGWLKAVFRVVPAFVLTLIPITMIYMDDITDSSEVFLIVVIYIVAVVVYFLYELFSTGKWKSAVQSLKGLWLLAVLNVAMLLILNGITLYAQNCIPRADEIVSVRLLETGDEYYSSNLEETELTGEEICAFTSKVLEHTVKDLDDNSYWNYADNCQAVAIQTTWGATLYRYLYMTYAQKQELTAILAQSETYRNVYLTLPDLNEWDMSSGYNWKDKGSQERIYQVLEQEIQEIGFTEWYQYISNYPSSEWVFINFDKKDENGYLYLPVSKSILPETYKQFVEELSTETDKAQLQYISSICQQLSREEAAGDIWFSLIDVQEDRHMGDDWFYSDVEIPDEWNGTETASTEAFASGEYTRETESVYENTADQDDRSVRLGQILSEIFSRNPIEKTDYLLIVNIEWYNEEEWPSIQETAVFITQDEASGLLSSAEY